MWYWLILAAVVWVVTFFLVPRERFVKLLPIGFVGGTLLAFVIQYLGVVVFKLWAFNNMLLPIMGIPLFLPIAYWAEVILFIHFLPDTLWGKTLYTLAFSAANTLVTYLMMSLGLQDFIAWSLLSTFIVAVVAHGIAIFLYPLMVERARVR
ncbi:MAG: hypothetical protein M0Z31_11260 [Clostridia bacterium]|nr:hypothetical protein [Clostridia bacterium]